MGWTISSQPTGFGQSARIALVGLDSTAASSVHGSEVGIGDYHLVAQAFEMARHPFALGGRLDQNVCWRAAAE